jgi:hypothetical protein
VRLRTGDVYDQAVLIGTDDRSAGNHHQRHCTRLGTQRFAVCLEILHQGLTVISTTPCAGTMAEN